MKRQKKKLRGIKKPSHPFPYPITKPHVTPAALIFLYMRAGFFFVDDYR